MKNIKLGFLSAILMVVLGSSIILVNSCKNEGTPIDKLPVICFESQVLPTFQNTCAVSGCHDGNGESRYKFIDYPGIVESGAVIAGNPDKSPAYQAMTSTFQLMPPHNPLPESKRAIIRLWIEQGAIETTCAQTKSAGTK
jgi:hypothetical protein